LQVFEGPRRVAGLPQPDGSGKLFAGTRASNRSHRCVWAQKSRRRSGRPARTVITPHGLDGFDRLFACRPANNSSH
jgi:hypothetical protein